MKRIYKNGQQVHLKGYTGMNYVTPWFEKGKWHLNFSEEKTNGRDLEIIVGAKLIQLPDKTNGNKMYFEMEDGSYMPVKKREEKKQFENDYFKGSRNIIRTKQGYSCAIIDKNNSFDNLLDVKYVKLAIDKNGPKLNFFSDIPKSKKAKVNRFTNIPFGANSFVFDDLYQNGGVETKIYSFNNQILAVEKLYPLIRKY
jgi:hypothetical protein